MDKSLIMQLKNVDSVDSGYKVIEVNLSDSTESLYAVCTPIKNNRIGFIVKTISFVRYIHGMVFYCFYIKRIYVAVFHRIDVMWFMIRINIQQSLS